MKKRTSEKTQKQKKSNPIKDSKPFKFVRLLFENIWPLMKLSAIFLVFSIPLITAFASFGAAVRCMVQMYRQKQFSLFKEFWSFFKAEFLRSTGIGAACALVASASFVSGSYYNIWLEQTALRYIAIVLFAILFLFAVCLFIYYLIVRATIVLPFGASVRNSIYFVAISLPMDIGLMAALAIFVLICVFFPVLLIFSPLLVMIFGFLCVFCSCSKIQKYMLPPEPPSPPAE